MSGTPPPADAPETEWFERWFGEEYLELYPHRDQEEARRAVELVLAEIDGSAADEATLDLGCGAGRHLGALRAFGVRAFGLDLSFPLLQRARARDLPVVRADMRELPFRSGSLALVTSFFTSFGYFRDPADDERVLAEVRRVLQPGGAFAFDYLNAARTRAELRPRDERQVGERRVVQTRRLAEGGRVVVKRISITSPGEEARVFWEWVRLYSPEEFVSLLGKHRLRAVKRFGDYGGAPLAADSPRVVLIGRAE